MVKYKRIRKITTGDIVYFNGTKIKTIEPHLYNINLGYPLGVVVIPPGMLPDGKARYCSIYSETTNKWGPSDVDTPLHNYSYFPITDNNLNEGWGNNYTDGLSWSCLPSDYFNGIRSFVDPKACYYEKDYLPAGEHGPNVSPSPYLGDDYTLNPGYIANVGELGNELNNPLGDLDGLSNTRTLIGLGEEYEAAFLLNIIYTDWIKSDIDYLNEDGLINYNSDLLNVETYLPSIGELGFIAARYKRISQSMEIIDKEMNDNWGWGIDGNIFVNVLSSENKEVRELYSSTEINSNNFAGFSIVHNIFQDYEGMSFGLSYYNKISNTAARHILPFAILE